MKRRAYESPFCTTPVHFVDATIVSRRVFLRLILKQVSVFFLCCLCVHLYRVSTGLSYCFTIKQTDLRVVLYQCKTRVSSDFLFLKIRLMKIMFQRIKKCFDILVFISDEVFFVLFKIGQSNIRSPTGTTGAIRE